MDWSKYPNFSQKEMSCKETGKCNMNEDFMDILQSIRTSYGKPLIITSGYRSKLHSKEASKPEPGEHTFGMAADIAVYGYYALQLIDVAISHGIKRIGVQQKGHVSSRYIHLGIGDRKVHYLLPGIWSY